MDTPLIVGIIVGTVLLPIYLIVGMIWLNKVKVDIKYKWKEKQPVDSSDSSVCGHNNTITSECSDCNEEELDDVNISQ